MPLWGQIALGSIFLFASVGIVGVSVAGVGPLSVVVFVGLVLIAVYIRREWKWPGFVMGILLSVGLFFLGVGICAVVAIG